MTTPNQPADALLPCPFCGETNLYLGDNAHGDPHRLCFFIMCDNPDCSASEVVVDVNENASRVKGRPYVWTDAPKTVAAWNTRTSPAALKTVYEALESDYMWNWLEEDKMWPDEMIEHQNKIENARSLLKPFVTEAQNVLAVTEQEK